MRANKRITALLLAIFLVFTNTVFPAMGYAMDTGQPETAEPTTTETSSAETAATEVTESVTAEAVTEAPTVEAATEIAEAATEVTETPTVETATETAPETDEDGTAFETNREAIWNYLYEYFNSNAYAVAGIMGNMNVESKLNPQNMEDRFEGTYTDETYTAAIDCGEYTENQFASDGIGYGLVQWTHSEYKAALYEYAKEQGKSIGDLKLQLDFLCQQFDTVKTTLRNSLLDATSVTQASNLFLVGAENENATDEVKAVRAGFSYEMYNYGMSIVEATGETTEATTEASDDTTEEATDSSAVTEATVAELTATLEDGSTVTLRSPSPILDVSLTAATFEPDDDEYMSQLLESFGIENALGYECLALTVSESISDVSVTLTFPKGFIPALDGASCYVLVEKNGSVNTADALYTVTNNSLTEAAFTLGSMSEITRLYVLTEDRPGGISSTIGINSKWVMRYSDFTRSNPNIPGNLYGALDYHWVNSQETPCYCLNSNKKFPLNAGYGLTSFDTEVTVTVNSWPTLSGVGTTWSQDLSYSERRMIAGILLYGGGSKSDWAGTWSSDDWEKRCIFTATQLLVWAICNGQDYYEYIEGHFEWSGDTYILDVAKEIVSNAISNPRGYDIDNSEFTLMWCNSYKSVQSCLVVKTPKYSQPTGYQFALHKTNSVTGAVIPIAGATFSVYANGTFNESISTNTSGVAVTSSKYSSGTVLTIYETSAPSGYSKATSPLTVTLGSDTDDGTDGYFDTAFPNEPEPTVTGCVTVTKYDAENETAQGGATLAGAKFDIINISNNSVKIDGFNEAKPGEVCMTITTAWSAEKNAYIATSGEVLPIGKYTMKESAASEGYLLNADWSQTFEVTAAAQSFNFTAGATRCPETVIRGGLKIVKQNDLYGSNTGADAKLDGIQFAVISENENPVLVNGVKYSEGETVLTLTIAWNESEKAWTAATASNALPYGTYTVKELPMSSNDTLANNYYLLNAEPQTLTISENGAVYTLTFQNTLRPGKLTITKVDPSGTKLSGAKFLLQWRQYDTDEWKTVTKADLTQKGGCTSAELSDDGTLTTDSTGVITFSGLDPRLQYRVTEIEAPAGYQLLSDYAYIGTLEAGSASLALTIVNDPNYILPSTGSNSMLMLPVLTAPLYATAFAMAYTIERRKRR